VMDISAAVPAFQETLLAAAANPQQPGAKPGPDNLTLESAKEFEAMVLATMLEPMFAGIKADGLFGGGQSEKIYRSMLVQEYAKSISSKGGIGLADSVHREMLKMQEVR